MEGKPQIHSHLMAKLLVPLWGLWPCAACMFSQRCIPASSLTQALLWIHFHDRFSRHCLSKKTEYPCIHLSHWVIAPTGFQTPVLKGKNFRVVWKGRGNGFCPFFLQESQTWHFKKRVRRNEAETPRRDRISISVGSLRQQRKLSGHRSLVNERVIQYSLCWV